VLDFFAAAPPLPAPGVPDLSAASDSGVSDADDITNLNNSAPGRALEFIVPGTVAGATVRILADGVEIGSAVALGTATSVTTDGATTLSDGSRIITATQTAPGGAPSSDPSPPLAIQIDTVSPALASSPAFLFETSPHQLAYAFTENVSATLDAADLSITPSQSASLVYDANLNQATWTFGGVIPDGNYSANLLGAGVTDLAGNAMADDAFAFKFLLADANNDGSVNLTDFNILAANFGATGRTFSQGNFDYDAGGNVTLGDFNILAAKFGTALAQPRPNAAIALAGRFASSPIRARTRLIDSLDQPNPT
jgi:hypothetical protein